MPMGKWPSLFVLVAFLTLLISMMLMGRGFAQAPPGIPMIVSGTVTLNGSPSPDGYNITALDNGAVVGSTLTIGGNYSVAVCGQAGQSCNQGDTISFQLDQLTTSQTTTLNRGFPATLNLAFTGTPNQQPQSVTTAQPSMTEAQTTTNATTVAATSSVSTPEYPNYLAIMLLALIIALGIIAVFGRRKQEA